MSSDAIYIEYTVKDFDGSLLSTEEFAPFLVSWTSAHRSAKRAVPIKWNADSDNMRAGPFQARAEFTPKPESLRKIASGALSVAIRHGESVGMQVLVHARSDTGVRCWQEAGSQNIPISILLHKALLEHKGDVVAANESMEREEFPLPLVFTTLTDEEGHPVSKGIMTVTGMRARSVRTSERVLFDLPRVGISCEIVPADEYAYLPANQPIFAERMGDILIRSMYQFTQDAQAAGLGFAPAMPECSRVHAPYFMAQGGIMPGFAFMLQPGGVAPNAANEPARFVRIQNWLRQLCDYSLKRASESPESFMQTVSEQLARADNTFDDSIVDSCELLGQMLAIAPTALPYVSDQDNTTGRRSTARVRANGKFYDVEAFPTKGLQSVERFSEAIDYDGGDCEDVGTFAYRIGTLLAAGAWTDPLVESFATLMRQYVPTVNLGSVRDASVGNDAASEKKLRGSDIINSEADRNQPYGAHMWCELIPVASFAALVRRSVPDVDPAKFRLPGSIDAPWVAGLPQLVIEGTGRISALQMPRVAYVFTGGAEKKSQIKARIESRAARLAELRAGSRTFVAMQMVREQQRTEIAPNVRLTSFYRQATHTFTEALWRNGVPITDWIVAQRGVRVPAPNRNDPLDEKNPLCSSLRAPTSETTATIAPAPVAGDARNLLRGETPLQSAMNLIDGNAHIGGSFSYGVALEDRLHRPLLDAVALLPGTKLHKSEVRHIVEMRRQAPPISVPGDYDDIVQLHIAAMDSREACGENPRADLKKEDELFVALQLGVRKTMGISADKKAGEWPKRGTHADKMHLYSMFFEIEALRSKGNESSAVIDAILEDVEKKKSEGLIKYARVYVEEPVPFRRWVVLQLMSPF